MAKEKVKNVRISEEIHTIAKVRSTILKRTIKTYLEGLILKDYSEAQK